MCTNNFHCKSFSGKELAQNPEVCQKLAEHIMDMISGYTDKLIDVRPHISIPNLRACFYDKTNKIILWVPFNLAFSAQQMAEKAIEECAHLTQPLIKIALSESNLAELDLFRKTVNIKEGIYE